MPLERRRHLRQRVHSPAYASVGAGVGGVVLDANERGAAIETVSRLAPQSFVDLRLDLLETHNSAVTPARVAWYSDDGRAGLEFLNLTGESRRQLQQWLLLNALLASESALLGSENAGKAAQTVPPAALPEKPQASLDPLQAAAEQALAATAAHGAAIALADGNAIICRATAGEIAPPPGSKLDTQAGISGACVRSGRWLRCDDPRLDPHVDRESCQALGINSVLAVPIGEQGNILGVVEVFSRERYAFSENHCSAVQELAKAIALSVRPEGAPAPLTATPAAEPVSAPPSAAESGTLQTAPSPAPAASALQTPPPAAPDASTPAIKAAPEPELNLGSQSASPATSGRQRIILVGVSAAFVIAGLWVALSRNPGGTKNVDAAEAPASTIQSMQQAQSASGAGISAAAPAAAEVGDSLQELRRRAAGGDAEAEFELGAKYASGEDVRQDYTEAVKWFTRAADAGQVLAAATLGAYYWAGRGVPQDDISAYMWSSIAKEGGDEASKYRLAILRARMTPAEVTEAEQRSAVWRQTHSSQTPTVKRTTQQ